MNKPSIYFVYEDGDIEGYFLSFEAAVERMKERIDEIIENAFLCYGYKASEIYHQFVDKGYTDLFINEMLFDDNGICEVYGGREFGNVPNDNNGWGIKDIETVKQHVIQRQAEYIAKAQEV